ncbi:MAG: helix-turn-helix domain-containing protein [Selenomonadaceae bacterium]|nr:helix-turn-helix domain-containing protein [Selenomonadaceae bacterium]
MIKSFKVMLVPNNRQRTRLFQFAGTARFACNWALRKEIDAYEAGEKNSPCLGTPPNTLGSKQFQTT